MKPSRRQLAQWQYDGIQVYGQKWDWFGNKGTYGYMSDDPKSEQYWIEQSYISLITTIAQVTAIASVSKIDAALMLPYAYLMTGFLGMENWQNYDFLNYRDYTNGLSGLFNILAGYSVYQVAFNKNRDWLPLVGTSGTLVANLNGQFFHPGVNNYAHWGGMTFGVFAGFLLSYLRRKRKGVPLLVRHGGKLSLLTIAGILYFQIRANAVKPLKTNQE